MAKRTTVAATKHHSAAARTGGKIAKRSTKKTGSRPSASPAPGKPAGRAKPGKMVYYFGRTRTEGGAEMKLLLGGKGANLADMTSIGLPVPPGFTITT